MMNIEQDLVAALEPIRQMTLAICVNHFFETGVYRKLEAGECDLDTLSRSLDLERARLGGLLGYLRNENIVSHDKGVYALTDKARLLGRYSAWYTMLVGGYTETFVQVGECLKGQGGPRGTSARSASAAAASAITTRFHLPSAKMDTPARTLLDLGCGNAMYLVEFCKTMPQLRAYGVEPSRDACLSAERIIAAEGLSDRIKVINKSVRDFLEGKEDLKPDVMVLGFVLHEILGQEGKAGVIDFLKTVTARYPAINLIVIEVDNQAANPTIMEHGRPRPTTTRTT